MSQVIVEFFSASQVGGSSLADASTPTVEEITSSGTNQATTATARAGQTVAVINNGSDNIWVNFGAAAAVGTGYFIAADKSREFGNASAGHTVNVINDS